MSQDRLNVISLTSFVETLGEQVALAILRDYGALTTISKRKRNKENK